MMETSKEFTEEALTVLESYVTAVGKALEETELTPTEIEESINDLRDHIIAHCEIRSNSKVITTDLVNTSIKKLGNPTSIAQSLQSELDIVSVVEDELGRSRDTSQETIELPSTFNIKAGHLTAFYSVICWLMTSVVIFVLYHGNFAPLSLLYPYLMGAALGMLILSRNLSAFSYNKHLQQHIRPNTHTSIVPLIYIVGGFANLYNLPANALWTTPTSLVLFLILASTEYGRNFYLDLISRLVTRIKEQTSND